TEICIGDALDVRGGHALDPRVLRSVVLRVAEIADTVADLVRLPRTRLEVRHKIEFDAGHGALDLIHRWPFVLEALDHRVGCGLEVGERVPRTRRDRYEELAGVFVLVLHARDARRRLTAIHERLREPRG